MEPENNNKKRNPLIILIFTVFVDMIGFGILIPIIPLLFADPKSAFYLLPAGTPISMGLILLGLLVAIYPLMQFFATPILGQLSDRYGRKKILAISLFGTCLSYLLFAYGIFTHNVALLFFSRALDGITGGNISVAQAAIADITPAKDRAKNFGLIGAAFGLGFILGPFLGGILSNPKILPWFIDVTPFLFAAGLSLINVISVLLFLPETLKHKKEYKLAWTRSIHNIVRAFVSKNLRVLFIVLFLFQAGFTFFTTFFSVYLINKFGFDQSSIGNFFAYLGLWIVFTQAVITRRLTGKFQARDILKVSFFAMGIIILLYLLPNQWYWLLVIAPFFAISNGITQAFSIGLVSSSVDDSVQGETLGISSSVQALAQTIPPIIAGFIAAMSPTLPIIVASGLTLIAWAIFMIFYKPCDHKIDRKELDPDGNPEIEY